MMTGYGFLLLTLQPVPDLFQRFPPRIFQRDRAGTLFLVQVLTTMQAEALAILAASHFQGQTQQHLLSENVLQQKAISLIISDLGFSVGY
jgi:hypothetical protein